jgi:predicted Kef-type K+ transport protein
MQIKKLIIPFIFVILALAVYVGVDGSDNVIAIQMAALLVVGFGLGVAYTMFWYNFRDKRKTKTPPA